jgi:Ran GTPase-activating protein (RanGAP) involved in mRNA processing and transport
MHCTHLCDLSCSLFLSITVTQELNICDNYVKRKGVHALIKSLPHYKSLRTLNMSDCFCYKRHATLFLEGLCTGAGSQLEVGIAFRQTLLIL